MNDDIPAAKVKIKPSPYFDVIVDDRVQRLAAPMAARAAMVGAYGPEIPTIKIQRIHKMIHQPDRSLPKWKRLWLVWKQI